MRSITLTRADMEVRFRQLRESDAPDRRKKQTVDINGPVFVIELPVILKARHGFKFSKKARTTDGLGLF